MRVVSSENDWTKYSYTSSAIEKRTGLTREEIRELRQYGKEEAYDSPFKREEGVRGIRNEDINPKSKPGINLKKGGDNAVRRSTLIETPFSVEANEEGVQKASINLPGGFGASYGNDGIGVSVAGFGVEMGEDKSSVELPGGTKITFVNKGCFVITVFTVFGVHSHSDIERKPGCDDDDDSGGGSDEPKPPHCIGSDGKPGTGKPVNLLPECTNDGKRHSYYIVYPMHEELTITYKHNTERSYTASRTIINSFIGETSIKSRIIHRQNDVITSESNDVYPIHMAEAKQLTYAQLIQYLSTRAVNGLYGWIGNSVPSERDFTEIRKAGTIDEHEVKVKAHTYAVVISPGSGCNPTGNEGCEDSGSSSSSNKKSTPFRPPRLSGGLKSKNKSTNDEDDDMSCCSKLEKKLGLDAFPGELPVSVLQKEDGEVVKIESLSQLILWLIDSLDERLGKFPIPITIEDTDPLKEGNQKKEFEIPNIAEMLAEQYGMMFQSTVQSQIKLNIQTNLLIENGLLKQSLTRVENILSEIVEYFGWQIKQSTIKVDIPFTPSKSNYEEFLQPSTVDVKRIDRIDDKTNLGLDIILAKLMEAATIIKQTNFRKINPNANVASQIADYARLGLDVYNAVRDNDKKDDQQWEDFKEKLSSPSFYGDEEKPIIGDVNNDTSSSSQATRTPGAGSRLN